MAMLGESIDPRLLRLDPQVFRSIESAGAAQAAMYGDLGQTAEMTLKKLDENAKTEEMYQSLLSSVDPLATQMGVDPAITRASIGRVRYDRPGIVGYDLPSALEAQKQTGRIELEATQEAGRVARQTQTEKYGAEMLEAVQLYSTETREDEQMYATGEREDEQLHARDILDWTNTNQAFQKDLSAEHAADAADRLRKGKKALTKLEYGLAARESQLVRNHETDKLEFVHKVTLERDETLMVARAYLDIEIDAAKASIDVSKLKDTNLEARNHLLALQGTKNIIDDQLMERHSKQLGELLTEWNTLPPGPATTSEQWTKELQLASKFQSLGYNVPKKNMFFQSEKELELLIHGGHLHASEMLTPAMLRAIPLDRQHLLEDPRDGAIILGRLRLGLSNQLNLPFKGVQPAQQIGSREKWIEKVNKEEVQKIYEMLGIKETGFEAFERGFNNVIQALTPTRIGHWMTGGIFENKQDTYEREKIQRMLDYGMITWGNQDQGEGGIYVDENVTFGPNENVTGGGIMGTPAPKNTWTENKIQNNPVLNYLKDSQGRGPWSWWNSNAQ